MKAVIIYESFFGNTEKVARAVGEALAPLGEVGVVLVVG
jgi:flavodoxin